MTATLERAQSRHHANSSTINVHPTFRPDVEGMRAIAVLLVVLYHCGVTVLGGGYVGVDVFFVISGFLITSLLLREFDVAGRISIAEFYARRFRRILPAALLTVSLAVAFSMALLSSLRIAEIAKDAIWATLFSANFRFLSVGTNYLSATAPPSPLQHFWSLAVEEQFYLVWPLLLWALLHIARGRKAGRATVSSVTAIIVVASFAWCAYSTTHNATQAYFSPWTRAWELGIGALVAVSGVTLASRKLPAWLLYLCSWGGVGMVLVSAFVYTDKTVFPGTAAALPVVGAGLLLVGGQRLITGSASSFISNKPMQWIGKLSYSWYLWHWPILTIATERWTDLGTPVKLLLGVGGGLGAAWLSFKFIESPIRRSQQFARSTVKSLIAGVAIIAVVLGYSNAYLVMDRQRTALAVVEAAQAAKLSGGSDGTSSIIDVVNAIADSAKQNGLSDAVKQELTLSAEDKGPEYSEGCLGEIGSTTSTICQHLSSDSSAPSVVLFGDSHAAQWMDSLLTVQKQTPLSVYVLAKQSCPAAGVQSVEPDTHSAYPQCSQWRQWALGQIAKIHPSVVVVSEHNEALEPGSPDWQTGLSNTLTALKASSGRVVLLADVPAHKVPTPQCLADNPSDIAQCADSVKSALDLTQEQKDQQTAEASGVSYVDTESLFCTATVCPGVINNIVTSFDGSHITASYAKYLGRSIGTAVGLLSTDSQALAAVKAALDVKTASAAVVSQIETGAYGLQLHGDGCLLNSDVATFKLANSCTMGDTSASRTLVLFGDSHAGMWSVAFDELGLIYGWKIILVAESACNASGALIWSSEIKAANTGCVSWHQQAMKWLQQEKPDAIVVTTEETGVGLASNGQYVTTGVDPIIQSGLTSTLSAMKTYSKKVMFLGDIPNALQDPQECISNNKSNIQNCTHAESDAIRQADIDREVNASSAAGVTYLPVVPWLCADDKCPQVINDEVMYINQYHTTPFFATSVVYAVADGLKLN